MINKKEGFVSYVLVCDVDNGIICYYTGWFRLVKGARFQRSIPQNSNDYIYAMKIPFKDEAELICSKINKLETAFKYHVEEHMYI